MPVLIKKKNIQPGDEASLPHRKTISLSSSFLRNPSRVQFMCNTRFRSFLFCAAKGNVSVDTKIPRETRMFQKNCWHSTLLGSSRTAGEPRRSLPQTAPRRNSSVHFETEILLAPIIPAVIWLTFPWAAPGRTLVQLTRN